MAYTKKQSRTRRRNKSAKRRGQTGGASLAPLSFSQVSGDTGGAAGYMLKVAGDGQSQTVGANGAIQARIQTGGSRRRRSSRASRKHRKLRGGSLMDALSSAIVPLALFGMNHKIGRKLRKKR
jgi:hypothetical protein